MPSAAFFDMDRTVLTVNTGTLWFRFLRRRGEISRFQMLRAVGWAMQFKLAILDLETLSRKLVATMAGQPEEEMIAKSRAWYEDEVLPTIAPKARAAIDKHRADGDRLVLLTSSTQYVAEPLARTLDLHGSLCSRLEVADGRFTGKIVAPLCFGNGKVALAERWAAEAGVDLAASTFYTDSYNDLPMMLRVGKPVAVNPDPRLARAARRNKWPVEIWDQVEKVSKGAEPR
jgi:HAD superfamily hydrolase (TIGR01490 family)